MEEFPISQQQWKDQFSLIWQDFTFGLTSSQSPLFFLHAGQPGAGKSELNKRVGRQLKRNILECNADNLREYHPHVEQILRERETDYPDLTWSAADSWNRELIKIGITEHYNLLIETTLHKPEQTLETFARMKENGYTTHLHVMAVPYRWSWVSIHLRYESLKFQTSVARRVSEADHDDRYHKLLGSLQTVIQSPYLDRIGIYGRKLPLDPSEPPSIELLTEVKAEAVAIFNRVLERPMDDNERKLFTNDYKRVLDFMEGRNAPTDQIQAFQEKAERLGRE